jgi:hypothetical protein
VGARVAMGVGVPVLFTQDPCATVHSRRAAGVDRAGGTTRGPNTNVADRVDKGFWPRLDAAWAAEVLCAQWVVGLN